MNKLLKALLILVVTLTLLGAFFIWFIGAWNILFPSSSHDKTPPELPAQQQREEAAAGELDEGGDEEDVVRQPAGPRWQVGAAEWGPGDLEGRREGNDELLW